MWIGMKGTALSKLEFERGDKVMGQIEKNTVSAKGQLQKSEFVSFINKEGTGKRILFVGNSITRHGVLRSIGWNNDWGMASSSIENDYVHIVVSELEKSFEDTAFCICQVASWEREYKNGEDTLYLYEEARNFNADIIIMRCIENCAQKDFDHEIFAKQYERLIDFLNISGNADVILTTGFWKHMGDVCIDRIANERGYKFAYLGELGEDDNMKAIGLFEHNGVANHPGDIGMKAIADKILEKIDT